MGITLAVVSLVIESWSTLFHTPFFDGFWQLLQTILYLTAGVIVPMSIPGIAKEVTTITISWIFGDELTPLNITGVGITVCGIGLFTYHKYRKSIESSVPLDAHDNPLESEEDLDVTADPSQ